MTRRTPDRTAPPRASAYEAFREALLEIRRAESDLERARTDFAGQDKLLAKGFISKSDMLTSEMAVRDAERKLESAKVAYDILGKYTYPQTLSQKRAGDGRGRGRAAHG